MIVGNYDGVYMESHGIVKRLGKHSQTRPLQPHTTLFFAFCFLESSFLTNQFQQGTDFFFLL